MVFLKLYDYCVSVIHRGGEDVDSIVTLLCWVLLTEEHPV